MGWAGPGFDQLSPKLCVSNSSPSYNIGDVAQPQVSHGSVRSFVVSCVELSTLMKRKLVLISNLYSSVSSICTWWENAIR